MTGSLLMTFPLGSSNRLETSLSLGAQTRQTFVSLAELEQRYIAHVPRCWEIIEPEQLGYWVSIAKRFIEN